MRYWMYPIKSVFPKVKNFIYFFNIFDHPQGLNLEGLDYMVGITSSHQKSNHSNFYCSLKLP